MKKLLFSFFVILVVLGFGLKVSATSDSKETANEPSLCTGSTACILFERSSNKILYQKEKDRRLPPASMTKIMTLLLIFEALDNGQISKNKILTITEASTKVEGSKAFLSIGDEISVDELLKCICIASANDAALAMAQELAGSEEEFVSKMNQKAQELNLKNTHFSDCTGLSSKNHYTSAYDLAVISDYLLDNYPDVLNYTNIKEDYIRKDTAKPFWLVNTNKMVGRVKYLDGLKTGYTSFSKYCITLHMKQENMSLIAVVFGYDKPTTRNAESLELLRYGFANYKLDRVIEKGKVFSSIDHILYKERINVTASNNVYYLCKKGDKLDYQIKYNYDLATNNGQAEVYLDDEKIGYTAIKTEANLKKKNLFEVLFVVLKKCFA